MAPLFGEGRPCAGRDRHDGAKNTAADLSHGLAPVEDRAGVQVEVVLTYLTALGIVHLLMPRLEPAPID